ncbi:hypothetical protein LOAG_17146 [Loa loa]|uniref:Uncharacterized protein n=1 Tax=Loa loa TaxID=7209 RepID=A0A1S0UJS3_LOALO|nr:hypothetical protein LOAG_17146 [Loa loa]EJD75783.1 hypothetical protein LOAG_17146 [Loa loa]
MRTRFDGELVERYRKVEQQLEIILQPEKSTQQNESKQDIRCVPVPAGTVGSMLNDHGRGEEVPV